MPIWVERSNGAGSASVSDASSIDAVFLFEVGLGSMAREGEVCDAAGVLLTKVVMSGGSGDGDVVS